MNKCVYVNCCLLKQPLAGLSTVAFQGFCCSGVDTLLNLELLHIYKYVCNRTVETFLTTSGTFVLPEYCLFNLFAIALCANMHDWLACAWMYMRVPACVCESV